MNLASFGIKISDLPQTEDFTDNVIPLVQGGVTKRVSGEVIKETILEEAKEYTDQILLAINEWLPPVNTTSQLQLTGLDNKRNYLCKVVADPVQSGVYQAIAGWTTSPQWLLFDDTVDLVNEQELEMAIGEHNQNGAAHENRFSSKVNEAPSNDQEFIRKNGSWVQALYDKNGRIGASASYIASSTLPASPTQQQIVAFWNNLPNGFYLAAQSTNPQLSLPSAWMHIIKGSQGIWGISANDHRAWYLVAQDIPQFGWRQFTTSADLSNSLPLMNGSASAGTSPSVSRADHVHPAVPLGSSTENPLDWPADGTEVDLGNGVFGLRWNGVASSSGAYSPFPVSAARPAMVIAAGGSYASDSDGSLSLWKPDDAVWNGDISAFSPTINFGGEVSNRPYNIWIKYAKE